MSQRFFRMISLGAACGALACSDPLPPAASAGLNFQISMCPVGPGMTPNVMLGDPPPSERTSTPGNPLFSGESGSRITCSVRGMDDFNFDGSVKTSQLGFTINGTYSKTTAIGSAHVGLTSAAIGTHVDQQNCTVQIVRTGTQLYLSGGQPAEIWARFDCNNLTAPPNIQCGASGEFLFQRCTN